jgi:cytosine deaminase
VEIKEQLKPFLDIQLVPMGAYRQFSRKEMEAVSEAFGMGIDGIGGAPHMSDTAEEDIDFIFKMAERYGTFIDLHTDESDDPGIKTVSHIAKRTKDYGYEGRVTVGHLCSLSAMDEKTAEAAIADMCDARLGAVTLPAANMYLQGRGDRGLVRRGVTRVRELQAAGVPLAAASDNVHDPFHPFGRGDMLQIGLLTGYAAHMGSPADLRQLLRMLTEVHAQIIGLQGYGLKVGNQADFVILDARSPEQIFTMLPESRWTFKRGRLLQVARLHRTWSDLTLSALWQTIS